MREILFRAKRTDNGEWVEGQYAYILNPLTESGEPIKHLICNGTNIFNNEIDPETLCQYTGLKDKNGNRIWENDIVSCEHEKYPDDNPLEVYPLSPDPIKYKRNYAVEFINTGSSYGYRLRNRSIHFMITGNVIYNHKIEVIGNIFDTPELLKGE